jgi:hypothetical protein
MCQLHFTQNIPMFDEIDAGIFQKKDGLFTHLAQYTIIKQSISPRSAKRKNILF